MRTRDERHEGEREHDLSDRMKNFIADTIPQMIQFEDQTRDYRSPDCCRWGSEPRRYEPDPASLRELPGLEAPPTTRKSRMTTGPNRVGFVSPSPPSCWLHRFPLLLSKKTRQKEVKRAEGADEKKHVPDSFHACCPDRLYQHSATGWKVQELQCTAFLPVACPSGVTIPQQNPQRALNTW